MSRNLNNLENQKLKIRREIALQLLSFFEGRSITDNDIAREEGGRPYFKRAGNREQVADFNISHSGNIVAVSRVCGEGLRTGCDIQIVKERVNTLQIADQFFSPAEKEYILTQNEQGNKAAFFEIWTLKECYIKLHGLSVFDMARSSGTPVPDFVNEDGRLSLTQDNASFFLFKLNDSNEHKYIMAVTVNGIPENPTIQWFSETSLSCECVVK